MNTGIENIFIMGIRRSGNHAIASWIRPQLNDDIVRYFNDHFYDTLSNDGESNRIFNYSYINKKMIILKGKYDVKYNLFGLENQSIKNYYENYNKWIVKINNKIKEDTNLNGNIPEKNKKIIIIRNPWNNMASEIQWHYNGRRYNVPKNKLIDLWNEYYENFINNTDEKLNFIIYDKWFIDRDYRENISKKLNLKYTDENLNLIEKTGNGSSFTKRMYNGHAQKMNVLNRYLESKDYPDMQMFVNSKNGKELKEKWNHICDLENIEQLKIN
jgi:hypothetical protein